MRIIPNAKK